MISNEYMFDKCILDDDENYPTLQKGIYIGRTGQVTIPNGCSPSGGPEGNAIL